MAALYLHRNHLVYKTRIFPDGNEQTKDFSLPGREREFPVPHLAPRKRGDDDAYKNLI